MTFSIPGLCSLLSSAGGRPTPPPCGCCQRPRWRWWRRPTCDGDALFGGSNCAGADQLRPLTFAALLSISPLLEAFHENSIACYCCPVLWERPASARPETPALVRSFRLFGTSVLQAALSQFIQRQSRPRNAVMADCAEGRTIELIRARTDGGKSSGEVSGVHMRRLGRAISTACSPERPATDSNIKRPPPGVGAVGRGRERRFSSQCNDQVSSNIAGHLPLT
jgi:hypothetical protein